MLIDTFQRKRGTQSGDGDRHIPEKERNTVGRWRMIDTFRRRRGTLSVETEGHCQ